MSQNPFEPGASVLDNAGLPGVGAFEPPSSVVIYALYANAAFDGVQIPMSLLVPEADEPMIWTAIGIFQLVAFIACVILWCQWVMRAARNIRLFSGGPFEFTPGWAAGWYFVPFLNLVRPYQAMKEILAHSRSGPDAHITADTGIVGAWWGAWIISNVLANLSVRIPSSGTTLVASAAGVVAAILAVKVVQAVDGAQLEAARSMPVG